jgi:hypothetical protein
VRTGGGNPTGRSETAPLWLVAPDSSACGRFEDTRRAKRLIADDGGEMIAGHLSCIGYANHTSLADLLRVARGIAFARGFPALFAAIPAAEAGAVLAHINEPGIVVAPATVFASGFVPGRSEIAACRQQSRASQPLQVWVINTAEI